METRHFIESIVREAGEILKNRIGTPFLVSHKGIDERNVITGVDIEVNDFLLKRIRESYPKHDIYSEEVSDARKSDYQWTIDPIDGTSNFVRGIPHYAVCVGFLEKGVPIAGAVYNPITNELFSFSAVEGAFCNGKQIMVRETMKIADAYTALRIGRSTEEGRTELFSWGLALHEFLLRQGHKTMNFGSSALDLCFVASGRLDAVIYGTFNTRDVACAIGILRAAGGEIYSYQTGEVAQITDVPQRIIATGTKELCDAIRTGTHSYACENSR